MSGCNGGCGSGMFAEAFVEVVVDKANSLRNLLKISRGTNESISTGDVANAATPNNNKTVSSKTNDTTARQ